MTIQEQAMRWMECATADADLIAELKAIQGDEKEINERFYQELSFGTAGLRGILGAGTNRMNIYTVGAASQGLGDFIAARGGGSAAIAYDSRNKSELFARRTASVLAANGVKVYLYDRIMPTPMLSYAIRKLGCLSGVVITASHNPAPYNGYKAYGSDGTQLGPEEAAEVLGYIRSHDIFTGIRTIAFDEALSTGKIEYISHGLIESYYQRVLEQQIQPRVTAEAALRVVYTPLNGAGLEPVTEVLRRAGLTDVTVVPEQREPDGNFPTCPYPNPEARDALEKGLALCLETGADLLLATDPDCDRVGIAVRRGDDYVLLTGNEVGVLMLDYIGYYRTAAGTMPERPVAVKSIVTTPMADAVAAEYGIEMISVLTGFKFIGGQISVLEQKGETDRFLLGFEESYGYMLGSYCRDKDAVVSSMIICEMASSAKKQGKTLVDILESLYQKHGAYRSETESLAFTGAQGMQTMQRIMADLRAEPFSELGGITVTAVTDYGSGLRTEAGRSEPVTLPCSEVLAYALKDGCTVIVRPSGTEPKMKVYYLLKAPSEEEVARLAERLRSAVDSYMGRYLAG